MSESFPWETPVVDMSEGKLPDCRGDGLRFYANLPELSVRNLRRVSDEAWSCQQISKLCKREKTREKS